jgi:hypothetical protein
MYRELADDIIRFFDRRAGFDEWWYEIDDETQQEIADNLAALLEKRIPEFV